MENWLEEDTDAQKLREEYYTGAPIVLFIFLFFFINFVVEKWLHVRQVIVITCLAVSLW